MRSLPPGSLLHSLPRGLQLRCRPPLVQCGPQIIRLIGRWKSDEMLRYLHVQAAPLMADYAKRMLQGGHYTLLPTERSIPSPRN